MPTNEEWDPDVLRFIASTVGTIRDRITGLDTRMDHFETRMGHLETRMDAGFTAVRGDIERVQLRMDSIERTLSDRPELLRLLGETSVS